MNMTEMMLIQMHYPMVDFSMPKLVSGGGKDSAPPDFQSMMERRRKADISTQEPVSRKKDSVQGKDSAPRSESTAPRDEETVSPEQLTGIPFAVPTELLLRPEILPMPEDLSQIAAVGLTTEGAVDAVAGQEIPVWMPDSSGAIPAQGEARTPEENPGFAPNVADEGETRTDAAQRMDARVEGKAERRVDAPIREGAQEESEGEPSAVLHEGAEAPQQPLFRAAEGTPIKVGETYRLDTEAQDMEVKLADTIREGLETGAQKIEIRLTPENLGTLTIRLTQGSDGALQVVLHTADAKVGDLLTRHLDGLHMALQGVSQGQVQVEVQRNQDSAPAQHQHQHQADPDGRGQQQQQQHRQERQAKAEDFLHQLRLGLLPLEDAI